MKSSLLLRIREEYSRMSNSQQCIADFILSKPEVFVEMTASEIGEASNTSSASVVRFARYLDFDGLEPLKRHLLINIQDTDIELDPILDLDDSFEIMSKKVNTLVKNSLQDLFYLKDDNEFLSGIELIEKANRVYIFGIGASSLPAYDFYHKLSRINKLAIFNFDTHMSTEFINYADKNDVLVMFSYSGSSEEIVYPAEIGKEKNVPIISITSDKNSPLANLSTIVLPVPQSEGVVRTGAITSKINSMLVADLIYLGLVGQKFSDIEIGLKETSQLTRKLKR